MASKSASCEPGQVTWDQNFTDFVIVTKSGEKLRVHQVFLAENSPVFKAMLTQDMLETQENQVEIKNFIWFYTLFTLSPFLFYRAHFSFYLANFYVRQTVKSRRTETKT